ncbi:hypothetical protein FJTKL_06379 [Diaporthe vaccinii]|uniref:Mating type protein 1-2-1 n=1 Tax=Diaporthe vaccinii TaxID=105482 RepID=A0ABR4EWR8_9PEZI
MCASYELLKISAARESLSSRSRNEQHACSQAIVPRRASNSRGVSPRPTQRNGQTKRNRAIRPNAARNVTEPYP